MLSRSELYAPPPEPVAVEPPRPRSTRVYFYGFLLLLPVASLVYSMGWRPPRPATPPPAESVGLPPKSAEAPALRLLSPPRHPAVLDTRSLEKATAESLLVKSLLAISENRMDEAVEQIDALLREHPNFRLAQLIKGDLLLARTRPIGTALGPIPATAEPLRGLRDEARMRLQRYLEAPLPGGRTPAYFMRLDASQKYLLLADVSKARLYLFKNDQGEARYVADYYISIGKAGALKNVRGDRKTPVGVYFVTHFLPGARLTDFYGFGAFPLNYPNELDSRLGRSGSGIWLHGTPSDTYSRAPRASDGCVVLSNPDLMEISQFLEASGTPVVLTNGIEWQSQETVKARADALGTAVEAWRRDWESLDTGRYLSHYSKQFQGDGLNLAGWSEKKRQVNAGKSWIKVRLDRLSMFAYPQQAGVVVVTYEQDYRSNNLNDRMRKRQYWKMENGQWKILYEGVA